MLNSLFAYTARNICVEDPLTTIVNIFLKAICVKFNFLGFSSLNFGLKLYLRGKTDANISSKSDILQELFRLIPVRKEHT